MSYLDGEVIFLILGFITGFKALDTHSSSYFTKFGQKKWNKNMAVCCNFCFLGGFFFFFDYIFRHGKSIDSCCEYSQIGLKYLPTSRA